jgi:DNA-binding MarR family transcriptional regulator
MTTVSHKNGNVTRRQRELLEYLLQRKQGSVGEIAAMLGVSSPAATKAVARLERKGLVARKENEVDRRSVCVSLTNAGMQALEES